MSSPAFYILQLKLNRSLSLSLSLCVCVCVRMCMATVLRQWTSGSEIETHTKQYNTVSRWSDLNEDTVLVPVSSLAAASVL